MTTKEEWATLKEFPGYQISSLGNLKLLDNSLAKHTPSGTCGYISMKLRNSKGVQQGIFMHRLVALAFIPNSDKSKTLVNHKNGIRHDNIVSNLEWVTPKENSADKKFPHKVFMRKVHQFTITGKFIKEWESMMAVAKFLDIEKRLAIDICKNNKIAGGFLWKAQSAPRDDNSDLPGEKWKFVKYEGSTIQVSNKGRVITSKGSKTFGSRQYKYLYLWINGKHRPIHQIVCTAFHGPKPGKEYVPNHIDNNGLNNEPSNLEWVTASQNIKHARSLTIPRKKLINQYSLDNELIATFYSPSFASRFLSINYTAICAVARGGKKTAGGYVWKYTTEDKIANVYIVPRRKIAA